MRARSRLLRWLASGLAVGLAVGVLAGLVGLSPTAQAQSAPDAPALSLTLSNTYGQMYAWWGTPADNGGTITGYRVEYKGGSIASWTHWANYETQAGGAYHWAKINGLSAGQTYEVRVRATNSAGNSAWSDVESQTIPWPPVPDKPVLEVDSQIHLNHGKIFASMTPANGDGLSYYEVQYRGGSTPSWTTSSDAVINSGRLRYTTVTGLDDGTEYELRARGVNPADVGGPWSDVQTGRTRAALQQLIVRDRAAEEADGRKTDLKFYTQHTTRGQIQVDWINRDSKPCVTFEVQYREAGVTSWTDQSVSHLDHSGSIDVPGDVWISGLTDGTTYEIRVRPVTFSHGVCEGGTEGPWSEVQSVRAPWFDKPALWFLVNEEREIEVRWHHQRLYSFYDTPYHNQTASVAYQLEYRAAGTTSWTNVFAKGTGAAWTFDSLSDNSALSDNTTYEFQLRARTNESVGTPWYGPWSDVASATTCKPCAPEVGGDGDDGSGGAGGGAVGAAGGARGERDQL